MQYHIDHPDAFDAWNGIEYAIWQLHSACRTIEPPHPAYEALGRLLEVRTSMRRHLGRGLIQSWDDEMERFRNTESDLDRVIQEIEARQNA